MDSLCPSPPATIATNDKSDAAMTSAPPAPSPPAADGSAAAPGLQSAPPLQHSKTPLPHFGSRHRRGNVARLPKALRDNINQMLDDGLPYAHIIRQLGPEGKGFTSSHIVSWKKGGYQDYLRQQQRLETCRLSHDFLASFLKNCQGVETYQAAPKLAASLLCETFVNLGPETIRRALEENPMNAFRLLNALARILSGGLRCERFLAQKATNDPGAASNNKSKGLTPPTFDQINDNMHLL